MVEPVSSRTPLESLRLRGARPGELRRRRAVRLRSAGAVAAEGCDYRTHMPPTTSARRAGRWRRSRRRAGGRRRPSRARRTTRRRDGRWQVRAGAEYEHARRHGRQAKDGGANRRAPFGVDESAGWRTARRAGRRRQLVGARPRGGDGPQLGRERVHQNSMAAIAARRSRALAALAGGVDGDCAEEVTGRGGLNGRFHTSFSHQLPLLGVHTRVVALHAAALRLQYCEATAEPRQLRRCLRRPQTASSSPA